MKTPSKTKMRNGMFAAAMEASHEHDNQTADASQNRATVTVGAVDEIIAQGKPEHSPLPEDYGVMGNAPTCPPSTLPWQVLDWMILCDKVNKYGNFYIAEVSPKFLDVAKPEALAEASANLKLIVASVNHADKLAEALRWIKEVVNERKGTAHWLQMVEDKSRNALAEWEKAKQ